jgi:protein-tyrosine phosphatase
MLSRRDSIALQRLLSNKLREIMQLVDLEEVSSKQIRVKLEEEVQMDLSKFRNFIDSTILVICGQMEKPSKIKDYLYLGSEWNAANFDELQSLGVKYILNCTREIDNFFPDMFCYKNIKVYDKEESDLMRHWDDTFRFISEARNEGVKILVHCRMGISRSAATVMAYLMKMYSMSFEDAKSFVKTRRSCVNPNPGFISQLNSYEGILNARNNPLWGAQANKQSRHKRSLSDPDLKKAATPNLLQPHLAYDLPLGSTPNIDKVGQLGIDLNSTDGSRKVTLGRTVSSPQCVRDAKNIHLMHFLASLPSEEDDLGITENTTSDSTSSFSSPLSLTPPDKDSLLIVKKHHMKVVVEGESDNDEEVEEEQETLRTQPRLGNFDEDRRGSHPFLSPKLPYRSKIKKDPFFQGKRASAADVLETVTTRDQPPDGDCTVPSQPHSVIVPTLLISDSDHLLNDGEHVNVADEMSDSGDESPPGGSEGSDDVENEVVAKQPKVSLSHSFPEDLNCSTLEAQPSSRQQHRRSRSEVANGDFDVTLDESDVVSAPVFEPQIESVQDAVKMMETWSSQTDPPKWYKRVFSAPSLATVSSGVPSSSGTPLAPPLRPSSRASNHSELVEVEECHEEEEEEGITFTTTSPPATTPAETPTTSGTSTTVPATTGTSTTVPATTGTITTGIITTGDTTTSSATIPSPSSHTQHLESPVEGESTGQVEVIEDRPPVEPASVADVSNQEPMFHRRWGPSHTRSLSNIETTSVRAMINSLEQKSRCGSVGSRPSARNASESKMDGSQSVEELSPDTQSISSDHVTSDPSRPSSFHLEETMSGMPVKKAQSMSSLSSGEPLLPLHALQRSGSKRDSITHTVSGAVPSAIPEGECTPDIIIDCEDPIIRESEEIKDHSDTDSVASVLELMQKFEAKPHVPQGLKHSFTPSTSSTSLNKLLTGGKLDTPLMSDDERSKSGSPSPSNTGMTSVEVQ